MYLEGWKFQEPPWLDPENQSVKFAADRDGVRQICAISYTALNDYFKTEDTSEAAFENFVANSEMVYLLAIRLISEGTKNENGIVFITSKICQENWP